MSLPRMRMKSKREYRRPSELLARGLEYLRDDEESSVPRLQKSVETLDRDS